MSLEIFGVTIPILSLTRLSGYTFHSLSGGVFSPLCGGIPDEAGGTSLNCCAPVFNTNTTFWTSHFKRLIKDVRAMI